MPVPETADVSQFTAVDQAPDPAAMIEVLGRLKRLLHRPKSVLLERLSPEQAASVLDVGCGTGDDVAVMASRMPPGGEAVGVDASEAMIAEARRRHAGLGPRVTFGLGDALALPYPDAAFDICRTETVLLHVAEPPRAVEEMARVTRPGGRVGALEIDEGCAVLDHPDQQMTRTILDAYGDAKACAWIGRQLPRLFRQAGLADVSVDPFVILGCLEIFRALLGPAVKRLCDERVLTAEQASGWWEALTRQADEGDFLGGAVAFVVTGTRPA
jgi:ubiquinone/menaquinone biosynthesis C-methylase UbiE